MGLSASQARLLSLTARQSNLEYEGQQINQQRTTLSNESSNYYNSLLEMDVPVPPSSNDYTKIVYNFTIGGNKATVDEVLPKTENGITNYLITYKTSLSTIGVQENTAYKTAASAELQTAKLEQTAATATFNPDDEYYLATMNRLSDDDATALRTRHASDTPPYKLYVKEGAATAASKIIGPSGYEVSYATYNAITDAEEKAKYTVYNLETTTTAATAPRYAISYASIPNKGTFESHQDAKDVIYKKSTTGTEQDLYSYKSSNQKAFTVVDPQYAESFVNADLDINDFYQYEASSGIRFVKREDVENNLNNQSRAVTTFAVTTIEVVKENSMNNATLEFDASGRISSITDEEGHTYTMTATTETDNVAYDDAYNQYEYNQYVYDQKQNEINANIEILQAQDKSLELRLSTLDTQHSAIQTELEAVKKVMSKNIDNSFKTFNA